MTHKSPFLVYQGFLSAEECDKIAQQVWVEPQVIDGVPEKVERYHEPSEDLIFEKFSALIPDVESHYSGFKYRGTEHMLFQQFPATGKQAEEPHAENAVYKRKKWVRVKERDLTGIIWLRDYRDEAPFDLDRHVYGGKLEFPVYNFGFQAQRGTLIIYPSNERFISLTTAVLVGTLHCVKVQVVGEGIWLYDPALYPGDFRTWFSDVV